MIKQLPLVLLLLIIHLNPGLALADEDLAYPKSCQGLGLKLPEHPKSALEDSAVWGMAARKTYEEKGMALHASGHWKTSNCYLIHALRISTDHSINLFNTVGFNYAALGDDKNAMKYFTDATGFSFDLDNWLKHKAREPFKTVLEKPVYKDFENGLRDYYEHFGIPIPEY